MTFGDGDEAQVHFLNVLEGKKGGAGMLADLFTSDHARRLSLHEAKQDEQAKADFYRKAREKLKGTGWVALIDKAATP